MMTYYILISTVLTICLVLMLVDCELCIKVTLNALRASETS